MKRFLLIATLVGALALPTAASAWDGVLVFVAFPDRVTAGRASVIDFHVMLGGKPLDLATVGSRRAGLQPTVIFHKGRRAVKASARRTLQPGVYRVRVVLPSTGGWSYTFEYDGLVRTFPHVVARG